MFRWPSLFGQVHGLAWGERIMHIVGTMSFRDEKNDLQLHLEFTPPAAKKTWTGAALGLAKAPLRMLWGSKTAATPANGARYSLSASHGPSNAGWES